jgi:hypothetical protein
VGGGGGGGGGRAILGLCTTGCPSKMFRVFCRLTLRVVKRKDGGRRREEGGGGKEKKKLWRNNMTMMSVLTQIRKHLTK